MNAFFLLTAFAVSSNFSADDFHYMKDNQVIALPLTNKLYFETDQKNADDLYEKLKPKDLERNLNGLVLTFEDKEQTLKALNLCLKDQTYTDGVHPVVKHDTIEAAVLNYLIVETHPTVKHVDYLNRLNSVADAKFEYVDGIKKPYRLIKIKDIKNPTNILALADLAARDTFWVKSAIPRLLPLNDYVTASLNVETPSQTDLGHNRIAKLVINVYDPNIVVRTDLLPMVGQGTFKPFPFAGDVWMDGGSAKVTETKNRDKRTITVEYPFKYLQFGVFAFEPIKISYEQDGVLREVSTKHSTFYIGSVIQDMEIEDVQPVVNNLTMSTDTSLTYPKFPKVSDYMGFSIICVFIGIVGVMLLVLSIADWLASLANTEPKELSVWDIMRNEAIPKSGPWENYYADTATAVDNVLIEEFGVSLHFLKPEDCNSNFRNLLAEFDNLYIPGGKPNVSNLNTCVLNFYKDRKYD